MSTFDVPIRFIASWPRTYLDVPNVSLELEDTVMVALQLSRVQGLVNLTMLQHLQGLALRLIDLHCEGLESFDQLLNTHDGCNGQTQNGKRELGRGGRGRNQEQATPQLI